jgi:SAM-dependent methyltransferase
MSDYRELLLGCGNSREKLLGLGGEKLEWRNLTTLDCTGECQPDIIWDLNICPWPIEDNSYDEIHAYEVMEHLGAQGDYLSFFAHFTEIWRILKPDGHFFATVPSRFSVWLWGDPGHRRAIMRESLIFLEQKNYQQQVGRTHMADYRHVWKGDFKVIASGDDHVKHTFALRAIK